MTSEQMDRIEEKVDKILDQPKALADAVRLLSKDMHTVSTRPCETCALVTNVLGEPFGCVARAIQRKKKLTVTV